MKREKENLYALALREVVEKGPRVLWQEIRRSRKPQRSFMYLKTTYPEWESFFAKCEERASFYLDEAERKGIKVLYPGDGVLSEELLQIEPPVTALFLLGDEKALKCPSVAVVGTRKPSPYGLRATRWMCECFARTGIAVVSGMALGIDAEAHRSTMEAGGITIAVLGSGVDQPHPRSNAKIYRKILSSGGAVVSEYPPGTQPRPYHFPARNRIIAGLARGVIVTEAPGKSGALITAVHAVNMGKEVFAVPGPVFAKGSEGTNRLIRDGAHPLTDPQEVIDVLFPEIVLSRGRAERKDEELSEEEKSVIELIKSGSGHVEEIALRLQKPPEYVLSLLTQMELKGLIVTLGSQVFVKDS